MVILGFGDCGMSDNSDFNKARREKNDEFYTQLTDIEKELQYYRHHFKGKVVYCNCDDPRESNFFKYFAAKFNSLGLKKLITTCYDGSPVAGEQMSFDDIKGLPKSYRGAHKIEIDRLHDYNKDGAIDLTDVDWLLENTNAATPLDGNGDFRSDECVELLKQADIVVTNPPFSLFREYVAQLVAYDKSFLILGHMGAVIYKEIFPLIQSGMMWRGPSITSGDREFRVPDDYPLEAASSRIDEDGNKFIRVKGVRWYTNMDHKKRHIDIDLYKKYESKEYPHYDNCDAIHVRKVNEIPENWDGTMGVPITFLDKYNPNQFEILGYTGELPKGAVYMGGKRLYTRILIQRKAA